MIGRRDLVALALVSACRGQSNAEPTPEPTTPSVPDAVTPSAIPDDANGDGCPDRMARVPGREAPTRIESFCLDKTEVTVRDYAVCVDAGECKEPTIHEDMVELATWAEPRRWDMPVNFVGPDHIVAFCRFIGGRLPTFVEWRWAWDRLSFDRFHGRPDEYQPLHIDNPLTPPPTLPCSVPSDVLGDGVCNLGGGWDEFVAEPRNDPGEQITWAARQREPAMELEDLRERYVIVTIRPHPNQMATFRCAK